jgi:SAM-dependent methyltransferase
MHPDIISPSYRVENLTADAKRTTLNIGAGNQAIRGNGIINADFFPGKNIDVVFDATKPWPIKENSITTIVAIHVLEHLNDFWGFFRECWRALDPVAGRLYLALPNSACDSGLGDVTHVQQWNAIRFCFLQPGFNQASHNPQHNSWEFPFRVEIIMERVNGQLRWFCRFPLWNLIGKRIIAFLYNGIVELKVQLKPLKLKEDLDHFMATDHGNMVPTAHFVYEHEMRGKALKPGEPTKAKWLDHWAKGFKYE